MAANTATTVITEENTCGKACAIIWRNVSVSLV